MSPPLDPRITVERSAPDRLLVKIERRSVRCFSLGLDEAAYLVQLLSRELAAPVSAQTGSAR